MTALAFCTITASTKRNADLGSGYTGAATEYLTGLAVTPLWPVNADTIQTLGISSPREYKECYHVPADGSLPDIDEGDILVHGGGEYPVLNVEEWTDGDIPSLKIVVQQVKNSWELQS